MRQRVPTANTVAFNDLAVLHSELDLRRRRERELSRQHQDQHGQLDESATIEPPSFISMPWEEIVLTRLQQRQHHQHQQLHHHQQKVLQRARDPLPPQMTSFANEQKKKEKTPETRRSSGSGASSAHARAGWFSNLSRSNSQPREEEPIQKTGHWVLKEKATPADQMQSLPAMGTLRDSGIGDDQQRSGKSSADISGPRLSRSETTRSSFGIILRDKFQKNPNKYFPNTSKGGSSGRGGVESVDSDVGEQDAASDISDTDTLIHSLSEGSFEKNSSSSLTSEGSSKSSDNCSSPSPHNSVEGSPRLNPNPSLSNPGVRLAGRTIMNYAPKESSRMLKELDKQRNNAKALASEAAEAQKLRKTSVERMIDDFHRNLPPQHQEESKEGIVPVHVNDFKKHDPPSHAQGPSAVKTSKAANGISKHGTLSSQLSNWSVASSVASFDYQPASGAERSRKGSSCTEKSLPTLSEAGERIPPDGASSNSPTPIAPRMDASKISRRSASSASGKSRKVIAGEDISDLLKAPNQSQRDDGFSNLRKLLSEGRIAGLNDKPPSFVPPAPPATAKPMGRSSSSRGRKEIVPSHSSAKMRTKPSPLVREGSAPALGQNRRKPPVPKPTSFLSQGDISRADDLLPRRSSRQAQKTPSFVGAFSGSTKALVNGNDVKFMNSRLLESVEDLTRMNTQRRASLREANAEVKKPSPSKQNQETKTSRSCGKILCPRLKEKKIFSCGQ